MSEPKKEYRIDGRDSTIFRVQKNPDNPYVMVDRRPIDNPELSYRAKGVLTYLLSRPDGWEVNIGDLVNHGIEGRDALRNTLTELREAGHLEYLQERESGKYSTGKILVYEVPRTENPATVLPDAVNPTQVLSKLSNKVHERDSDFKKISSALSALTGGGLNPTSADLMSTWLDKHPADRIIQAVQVAQDKGARSAAYVDKVLIGWEANGYPKSRDEQIRERKQDAPQRNPQANIPQAAAVAQEWLRKKQEQRNGN